MTEPNHEELRKRFDECADTLWKTRLKLLSLKSELRLSVDQQAIKTILTDLAWAVENCTVVGLHQVGEDLDDNMGYTPEEPT